MAVSRTTGSGSLVGTEQALPGLWWGRGRTFDHQGHPWQEHVQPRSPILHPLLPAPSHLPFPGLAPRDCGHFFPFISASEKHRQRGAGFWGSVRSGVAAWAFKGPPGLPRGKRQKENLLQKGWHWVFSPPSQAGPTKEVHSASASFKIIILNAHHLGPKRARVTKSRTIRQP